MNLQYGVFSVKQAGEEVFKFKGLNPLLQDFYLPGELFKKEFTIVF
jgi:hypothetical protein